MIVDADVIMDASHRAALDRDLTAARTQRAYAAADRHAAATRLLRLTWIVLAVTAVLAAATLLMGGILFAAGWASM